MKCPDFFIIESTIPSFRSFLSSRTSKPLMKAQFVCLPCIMDHGTAVPELTDMQPQNSTSCFALTSPNISHLVPGQPQSKAACTHFQKKKVKRWQNAANKKKILKKTPTNQETSLLNSYLKIIHLFMAENSREANRKNSDICIILTHLLPSHSKFFR